MWPSDAAQQMQNMQDMGFFPMDSAGLMNLSEYSFL